MNFLKQLVALLAGRPRPSAAPPPPIEEELPLSPTDMLALSPVQLRIMRLMLRANEMSLPVLERALQALPPEERPTPAEFEHALYVLVRTGWLVQVAGSQPPVYRTGRISRTGALNRERETPPLTPKPAEPSPLTTSSTAAAEGRTPPAMPTANQLATAPPLEQESATAATAQPAAEHPKPDLAERRRRGADRLGDFWKAVDDVAERPPKIDIPTNISGAFMSKPSDEPGDQPPAPPPSRPKVTSSLFEDFVAKPPPKKDDNPSDQG